MSEAAAAAVTIGQHLPWVNITLDYLDRLVGLMPEEMLDWRPTDPGGHFMFSLGEIVMHCIDERLQFARQLAGSDDKSGYYDKWMAAGEDAEPAEGADDEGWQFRPHRGRAALLESLAGSRAELQPWLDLPVSQLHTPTAGTQKAFEDSLAMLREREADSSAMEARGPATINRVLFALCTHEAGHRATLQTLLRLNGVDARGEG